MKKPTKRVNKNNKKYHSLSRRIVAQFCIFTLILSLIYSAMSFLLMYDIEDTFIYNTMEQEAQFLHQSFAQTGTWPEARNSYMALYFSMDELPEPIKTQLLQEPRRGEFYGEQGKHYHLYKLPQVEQTYLLAEVSAMLVVRPITGVLLKFMSVLCLILIFLACSIAWFLGRKTAKPLQQLADLVDGAALEDVPEQFAQDFPNNEIGILASTLEQSMARNKQALSREKNFTRDVSHELRTPVAIIKNAVEVYQSNSQQNDSEDKTATDSVLKRISDASVQMEQTVVTLLSLAREEHTKVEKSSVKLIALVEQSVIDHSYLLNNKVVDVVVQDNTDCQVYVQPGMLKVLLDNLIGNAFQYTDTGEVNISYVDNSLVIADTGSGIEADIADKVTEHAVKGSQSTGYGFGLSIVKRLCEHQGWQLKVSSDQGTVIQVSFGEESKKAE